MMKTKKIAILGLLLAAAVILGYVEAILPLSVGIPGIKLGLANAAILFVLYVYGVREAALISVLRTVIIAFLFTNLSALLYSFSGAVVSLCAMAALKRLDCFSIFGVSAFGGAVHNATQFAVAFLLLGTPQILGIWSTTYLPLLLLSGLAAGCINALIAGLLKRHLKKF